MTSFKKENKTTETVTLDIPNTETQIETPTTNSFAIGKVSGPIKRSDIKLPSLNIAHTVGDLGQQFEPGSIVLNKEAGLTEGPDSAKPVKLTVLSFKRYFLEKLATFGETMPRMFNTEEDLAKAGLHTNWVNDTPPPAIDAGEALIAIESDTEHPHFPFSFGDKHYALAIWRLNSQSAFTRAGKLILTASEWNLKDGLHNGSWFLNTRKEKLGKNWVMVPVLKSGPRNSKELADFFASLL